jgi:hypothetical protein
MADLKFVSNPPSEKPTQGQNEQSDMSGRFRLLGHSNSFDATKLKESSHWVLRLTFN